MRMPKECLKHSKNVTSWQNYDFLGIQAESEHGHSVNRSKEVEPRYDKMPVLTNISQVYGLML